MIWWLNGDKRLSPRARETIAASPSPAFVSAASVWEASIKRANGKLEGPELLGASRQAGLDVLPITGEHARAAGDLPPHHKDPFDRMLVAQAQLEDLVVVSLDPRLAAYGVPVLW